MPSIVISANVKGKLETKHQVTELEVRQCFENKCGFFLIDDREDHRRNPPTLWFIAETNKKRPIKVVFQCLDGNFHLLTAYCPNADEVEIYENNGK